MKSTEKPEANYEKLKYPLNEGGTSGLSVLKLNLNNKFKSAKTYTKDGIVNFGKIA